MIITKEYSHLYAILDIETTGGQFNEEGITEIAIYRFDGHQVTDQFISLVNPEIPIQPFVVKLTGINNAMLQTAPKFFEVAKRIIEITQDCILVAHNASFDFRILRTEFRRLGFDFQSHTLCTVELAQKLIPDQPSYSLGKLVRALGIPMADRHRANGDALATVKLFKMLLDKDLEKTIVKELIKTEVEKGISPKLLDIVESLPSKTGIYYIHNESGNIIFIGHSRNIKKRVNQHFTAVDSKSKKIQTLVFTVAFEETGSELIAMLKEIEEIKINRPMLNRTPGRLNFGYALYAFADSKGYQNLRLQKTDSRQQEITSFGSLSEARNALVRMTAEFQLCPKLTGLDESDHSCKAFEMQECGGACVDLEPTETYNMRVIELIAKASFTERNLMIIDRGRNIGERSAILIENGIFRGYTFYELNYQIHNMAVLKNILIPMENHRNTRHLIQSWLSKSKSAKIIRF